MPKFQDTVQENFEKSILTGKKVRTVYGRSSSGQQYACFVSSAAWYAVRLIMEEEYLHLPLYGKYPPTYLSAELEYTQHLTMEGANAKIAEYQNLLSDIDANCDKFYALTNLKKKSYYMCKPLPNDWGTTEGAKVYKYLERGDIIRCDFYLGTHHLLGIYLGNGKVAHISGHGDGKEAGKARISDLIPHFVENADKIVEVVVLRVRARTKEKIASTAEKYAMEEFQAGQYNMIFRNCQHFAVLCALGIEFDFDALG